MKWISLGLVLLLLLVGALLYSNLATEPAGPVPEHVAQPRQPSPSPPPRAEPPPPEAARPTNTDAGSQLANAVVAPPPTPGPDEQRWDSTEAPAAPEDEPEDAGTLYPLNPRGIREALKLRQAELSACYSDWLKSTPEAPRRVMLSVRVMAIPNMGRAYAESVKVDDASTGGELRMGRCVKAALKSMRFETPAAGWATIAFPLKAQ